MTVVEADNKSGWSRDQDKAFENALAIYPENCSDRWEKIAADVGGKTLEEIKEHYERLVDDLNLIELGCVPLPQYDSSNSPAGYASGERTSKKGSSKLGHYNSESSKISRSDQERRKGSPWTEEEHRSFLAGLNKYGKGDWRSISRNYVVSRTPTQVASHAQKYFIRLNNMNNKDRRRSSIHDITSVGSGDISVPHGPITGQLNGAGVGGLSGKSAKQPFQHPAAPAGVGIYGAPTIGQPIGGPLVSAVGTPVNLPAPAHMAYGVRALVPGAMVQGAPMNMGHAMYPMPHKHAHSHRTEDDKCTKDRR